jgi:hypothetical protein
MDVVGWRAWRRQGAACASAMSRDAAVCWSSEAFSMSCGAVLLAAALLRDCVSQTHFIRAQLKEAVRKDSRLSVRELDGSNDIFTMVAISDWLEANVPLHSPCVLLCDEYHMMSRPLKEQMLQWCATNRWLRLVMISNRYDTSDVELFRQHLCPVVVDSEAHVDSTSGCIVHARGSIAAIMKKGVLPHLRTEPRADRTVAAGRTLLLCFIWLQTTSGLLGDELWSLRYFNDECPLFHFLGPLTRSNDMKGLEAALTAQLQRQQFHLAETITAFVTTFVKLYLMLEGPIVTDDASWWSVCLKDDATTDHCRSFIM